MINYLQYLFWIPIALLDSLFARSHKPCKNTFELLVVGIYLEKLEVLGPSKMSIYTQSVAKADIVFKTSFIWSKVYQSQFVLVSPNQGLTILPLDNQSFLVCLTYLEEQSFQELSKYGY